MSLEFDSSSPPLRLKFPFRWFSRLGNCYCVLISSSGDPWICIGPDWPLSLMLLTAMSAVAAVFVVFMAPLVPEWVQIVGAIIVSSALSFFLVTVLKNPGIQLNSYLPCTPLPPTSPLAPSCSQCGAFMHQCTYHCEICDLCINNYDHHCPLTGKCIGDGNLPYFYSFLVSVFLFFGYGAVLTVFSTVNSSG